MNIKYLALPLFVSCMAVVFSSCDSNKPGTPDTSSVNFSMDPNVANKLTDFVAQLDTQAVSINFADISINYLQANTIQQTLVGQYGGNANGTVGGNTGTGLNTGNIGGTLNTTGLTNTALNTSGDSGGSTTSGGPSTGNTPSANSSAITANNPFYGTGVGSKIASSNGGGSGTIGSNLQLGNGGIGSLGSGSASGSGVSGGSSSGSLGSTFTAPSALGSSNVGGSLAVGDPSGAAAGGAGSGTGSGGLNSAYTGGSRNGSFGALNSGAGSGDSGAGGGMTGANFANYGAKGAFGSGGASRDLAGLNGSGAMGSQDPENYFSMTAPSESIFKIVTNRYISHTESWALADSTQVIQDVKKIKSK